ncbi:hypothetical protein H6F43_17775, partial [Leptolyngbya sp. FACHB-36]|nr:hypothetical protein [Leptolyngbya sp. FACHB-36]
ALALGGAPINAQIPPECSPDVLNNTLNLSLLLQCRAFQPGQTGLDLHDRRVKAIIAMNPIASAVFGRNSIQQVGVPTMIVAGNADTIAPALQEQIQPFTWLTTNDKYLLLLEQGTHFSVIGTSASGDVLPIPEDVIGPSPATARRYASAMSVAFFQTYLANQSTFRPYLSATYTRAISEAPIELSLVRSFSSNLSFR